MTNILYQPKGKAQEYARWAINHYQGCSHACVYCYAAGIACKFKQVASREAFHQQVSVKRSFDLEALKREANRKREAIGNERVLLAFTTDPYQSLENTHGLTHQIIKILHAEGIGVHILTKKPCSANWDRDILDKELDAVATTLTFSSKAHRRSVRWEPHADYPAVRYVGLQMLKRNGFFTWASLEPVIDPAETLKIIEETHEYVDHYKIGKLNHVEDLPTEYQQEVYDLRIDWPKFVDDATNLLHELGYAEVGAHEEAKQTYQLKDSLRF